MEVRPHLRHHYERIRQPTDPQHEVTIDAALPPLALRDVGLGTADLLTDFTPSEPGALASFGEAGAQ